jgi:hypothetical protein
MLLYTGIPQLGNGMALYTGDSGDPVFRGWLKKSTPNYFSIVQHLRTNRRVLVHLLASRFANNGFDEEGNLWNGTASWKLVEEEVMEEDIQED